MNLLAWRSSIVLTLPLLALGCPAEDPTPADDSDTEQTDSGGMNTTASTPDDSTGDDEDTDPGNTSMPATGDGSTSSGSSSSSDDGEDDPTNDPVSVCGNNMIEGDEVCDLAQLGGQTCQSLGYQGGQLGCLLTCDDYNLLGCFICGNEVVDIAEDCEGSVPEEVTCESLGYEAGTITCGDDCLYDTSECSICGDGIQQGPEQCDGIDLGGETCNSIGFDMGTLGCNVATCTYNASGCSGGQYIQNFEAGVMPPEFTLGGNQGWVVDNNMPVAGSFSAHSGPITHSQTSSMSLTAQFAVAGEIQFMHRESTEPCCDHHRLFVDGLQVATWSGTMGPAMHVQPVAAGMHTIEWRYVKDGSVNTGSDRVWVDDLFLVNGVPL